MAALTATRDTKRWGESFRLQEPPVKLNTVIYQGGILVMDAGYACPGRTATGLICLGRAEETVNNNPGAAGAKRCKMFAGVFNFASGTAGDAITQANAGADCYIIDDQTVGLTDGGATRSRAGKIEEVDADGVWVRMGMDQ